MSFPRSEVLKTRNDVCTYNPCLPYLPVVLLQVYVDERHGFSFEICVLQEKTRRVRLIFSTSFTSLKQSGLHVQIPLIDLPRNVWLNLFCDVSEYVTESKSFLSIQINGICHIRRIFLCKSLTDFPANFDFLPKTHHETFLVDTHARKPPVVISSKKVTKRRPPLDKHLEAKSNSLEAKELIRQQANISESACCFSSANEAPSDSVSYVENSNDRDSMCSYSVDSSDVDSVYSASLETAANEQQPLGVGIIVIEESNTDNNVDTKAEPQVSDDFLNSEKELNDDAGEIFAESDSIANVQENPVLEEAESENSMYSDTCLWEPITQCETIDPFKNLKDEVEQMFLHVCNIYAISSDS